MTSPDHTIRLRGPWKIWFEQAENPPAAPKKARFQFNQSTHLADIVSSTSSARLDEPTGTLVLQRHFNWPNVADLSSGKEQLFLVADHLPAETEIQLNRQTCYRVDEDPVSVDLRDYIHLKNELQVRLPVHQEMLEPSDRSPLVGEFCLKIHHVA